MKTTVGVPQKIKKKITICSSNPTTGYIATETQIRIQRDVCTPIFAAALFTTAKTLKQPNYPLMDGWMKKMCCVSKWDIIQPLKKKILLFVKSWMNLEDIVSSETSQTQKDKYYMPPLM